MSYKIKLDIFEGPLDLLLYLIKKNDIDVCDIPIATITDQYMEYIGLMQMLDLEFIGEFLVMAATLLQIKSRMLLPPDPSEAETPQDPREDLVKRLQEYQIFKEIAEQLKVKELQRQNLYQRHPDETASKELKDEAKEVYFEANLFDLISAFTKALRKFQEDSIYELIKEEFTVDQKIHDILHLLLTQPSIRLFDLFLSAKNRLEVVVCFMAVLELIRLKEIRVMQKRLFGDIEVLRNVENVMPVESQSPEVQPDSQDPAE